MARGENAVSVVNPHCPFRQRTDAMAEVLILEDEGLAAANRDEQEEEEDPEIQELHFFSADDLPPILDKTKGGIELNYLGWGGYHTLPVPPFGQE